MNAEQIVGVLFEDRPADSQSTPEITAQLEDPATKTRPGVVAAALERQGIPVFFVAPAVLASGKIDTYRRLNPDIPGGFESFTVAKKEQAPLILAARIRDWLGNDGRDPSILPLGNTYNSRKIREAFIARARVKTWLDDWLDGRFRIPQETIRRGESPQEVESPDFMVKPLRATETTTDKQWRAAVISRTALQASLEAFGGEAVVQPRLRNVEPRNLVGKLGLDKLGIAVDLSSVAPEAHNELTIYHTPGIGSRAAVAELKFHNPADVGSLYGTWSMPFDMNLLGRALPDAREAYEQIALGLDEDFLGLCNVGIKLVLSTCLKNIKVRVNTIALRPFTPDADQQGDEYRQYYADALAQAEIDAIAAMFRSKTA